MAIDSITTTSYDPAKTLAAWIQRSAELEGFAAGIAARLAHGTLITPEERDFVGDVIFPEELSHRDALRAMARSMLVELPKPWAPADLSEIPEVRLLLLLSRGEGNLLLDARRFQKMLDMDPWFLETFKKIVRDEEGHRRWSRKVIHRLHEEGEVKVPAKIIRSFDPYFFEVRDMVEQIRADQRRPS